MKCVILPIGLRRTPDKWEDGEELYDICHWAPSIRGLQRDEGMNMGNKTEGSDGWTPPATSSTERALLRKMMDNYYGLYLLDVIQGVVHNLSGPLQIAYIRSEQLQQDLQKLISTAQLQQSPGVEDLLSGMEAKIQASLSSLDDLNGQLKHLTSDLVAEGCSAVGDVNINQVVEECLFLLNANMFFKHSVGKTVKLEDDIPIVKGRKTDFSIITLCLLQNAAEAMVDAEEKHIAIETFSQEDAVMIRVQDSGCGISEQDRTSIYEVCYTTKNRTENEGAPPKHAGLGLCLVSLVLEEYKGSIVCESIPGQTTFTVQIPLNADSSD
jgi:signal transduction histidine kinase